MASLVYIRSARPAWSTEEVLGQPRLTVRPYFKKKKKKWNTKHPVQFNLKYQERKQRADAGGHWGKPTRTVARIDPFVASWNVIHIVLRFLMSLQSSTLPCLLERIYNLWAKTASAYLRVLGLTWTDGTMLKTLLSGQSLGLHWGLFLEVSSARLFHQGLLSFTVLLVSIIQSNRSGREIETS